MRQLLSRWAELEPERCQVISRYYRVDGRIVYNTVKETLEIDALMRIQWAVQEAIVSRGWGLELDYYSGNDGWRATVKPGPKWVTGGSSDAAEALLSAYLKALEEVKR